MSANIFSSEQHTVESFNESTVPAGEGAGDKSDRETNDIRLQDIEEQLEMAESRCNNLKDQLDYMKQVYGVNRNATPKSRKISNAKDKAKTSQVALDDSTTSTEDNSKSLPSRAAVVSRQKSNAIETDNSGAAVRTINNILNGITNSVNRLSEIHSQIATPRQKISTGVSSRSDNRLQDLVKSNQHPVGIVPELKIESSSALTTKTRGQKRKAKSGKASSQLSFKKASRFDKKVKSALSRSSAVLEKQSSTTIKNRFYNRLHSKNKNLVEIYHNNAVKHSDSDESNLKKSRQQRDRDGDGSRDNAVPPLDIKITEVLPGAQSAKTEQAYQNGLTNQFCCDPPHAPRTTLSCCYSRNYELPTVASRMKQVAKSYLGSLNLKTIPFCAAISTTQSHNIGINIQQVMNIIKNRQPINGISPTLAHNIGLAAEKLNNKPFSTLISTINSRITQTASRCPLSKTYLNFQQLQEQARTIPEDTIEEGDEDVADSPQVKTMIITGPSGDMEIKTKNTPMWRLDKNVNNEQCTCLSQNNVGFHHIESRYQRNNKSVTENSVNSQVIEQNLKTRLRRYKATRNRYFPKTSVAQEMQVQTINPSTINRETQKEDTLKGKEKNLKEVLMNLHSDFESLNKKYEELSEKSLTTGNGDCIKELERLEAELSKKEEEITMVMTLYKEVLALKQQVKQLKEKRSQASIPSKDPRNPKTKFEEYNNPEAAFHLTKLLKQIQHYQMRYKTNLCEE